MRKPIVGTICIWSIFSPAAFGGIEGVPTGTAGFVGLATRGKLNQPVLVTSEPEFLEQFGELDPGLSNPYLAPSVSAFFSNGGARCWVVRVEDDADKAYLQGLKALGGIDEVALVAIPGATSPKLQAALVSHCEELGDRFAILDSAFDAGPDEVLVQRQALRSDRGFASLYYPWLRTDAGDAPDAVFPPSGAIAGLFARIDQNQGVWNPPANAVFGAAKAARALTAPEIENLSAAGIDVIQPLPGKGLQVLGARTISGDPEWMYVHVRRLLIFLEESISKGTAWAVFEPNDEPLWARLRTQVEDFLFSLWLAGALLGTTPDQAFFVKVDRTTMSQDDIDQGRTVILAGIAPIRPAEFMLIRIVQARGTSPRFLRGDATSDGNFDISDAVAVLGFLFLGTAPPRCIASADADGSGTLDISDAVHALGFLFLGGPPPTAPFPGCGPAPAGGNLDCIDPPPCPAGP